MGAQQAVAPAAADRLARVLSAFLRVTIGLVLLATAVGKFLDVPGFARVLETYRAFPAWSLAPLAWLIPIAETALAVWLLSGRRLRGAALASLALHGLYAGWSVVSIERGLHLSNCGCFGVFLARPLNWSTVAEDGILMVLSAALAALGGCPSNVRSERGEADARAGAQTNRAES